MSVDYLNNYLYFCKDIRLLDDEKEKKKDNDIRFSILYNRLRILGIAGFSTAVSLALNNLIAIIPT